MDKIELARKLYAERYKVTYTEILPFVEQMEWQNDDDETLRKAGFPQRFLGCDGVIAADRKKYFVPDRASVVAKNLMTLLPLAFNSNEMNILDAGCGYGEYMCVLDALGHRVVGINPPFFSADFWHVTNKLGLNVMEHDLNNPLPFDDKTFDAVLCIGVVTLRCFKGVIEKIISELHRVSNGIVAIRCHPNMMDFHGLNSPAQLVPPNSKVLVSTKQDVAWKV